MVEHGVEFETTFQNEKIIRVPIYRKPTREIYSVYKKIRIMMFANEYKK